MWNMNGRLRGEDASPGDDYDVSCSVDMAEVELPQSMELTFTQTSCDKRPICVGRRITA